MNPRIRRTSLAVRLIGIYTLVVAAALLVVASLVVYLTRQQLLRELDRSIAGTVDQFEAGPGSQVALPEDLETAAREWLASTPLPSDLSVLVRLPSSRVLASAGAADVGASPDGRNLLDSTAASGSRFAMGDTVIRARSVPVELDGRPIGNLVVGALERRVDETVNGILQGMAIACGAGILIAAGLGYLSTHRTLQPLRRFARQVHQIEGTNDLTQRLADGSTDEVGRLAVAFDDLLRRLQASFDTQKRFVADASHELRTPLTIARGQIELLGQELTGASAQRSAGIALEELDRMSKIVEDLLLLARLDEGLRLQTKAVEVELVVQEALLRGMLIARRETTLSIEPGLFVDADPDRLLQVLTNLVTNSIRHGGPAVELSITAATEGDHVVIAVSDTGPGIAPEELERIFDRLFRGSGRPAGGDWDRSGGAGLGLAIARSLTEAMGGALRAESEPGKGTTMTLRLPRPGIHEESLIARSRKLHRAAR